MSSKQEVHFSIEVDDNGIEKHMIEFVPPISDGVAIRDLTEAQQAAIAWVAGLIDTGCCVPVNKVDPEAN